MRIGLRILHGKITVFGSDDSDDPLPPDLGREGYWSLLAIANRRREPKDRISIAVAGELLRLIEAAEEDPVDFLPNGFFIIEASGSAANAGLSLYDALGELVSGPLGDAADMVSACASQPR